MIATGARAPTPIIEICPPHNHPPLETPNRGMGALKRALHARYDWTTGAPANGNKVTKFCVIPCLHPFHFLVLYFIYRGGTEGLLEYPERVGIMSIVRWNLRLVMFGVDGIRLLPQSEVIQEPLRLKLLAATKLGCTPKGSYGNTAF